MSKLKYCVSPFSLFIMLFYFTLAITASVHVAALAEGGDARNLTPLVNRDDRTTVVSTEYGQITSARVSDRINGSYHLQFITLEPNSLFLPVILHADMVFYVHTGTGRLSWTDEDEMRHSDLRRGDVYRLRSGTVFFVQSSLESERQKLRIYAIFANSNNDLREPATQPYSSISDMVLGFDKNVLQAAFKVPEDVIEDLTSGTKPPTIVHGEPRTGRTMWKEEVRFIKDFIGHRGYSIVDVNKKKGKSKLYNILTEDRDFENCNGWSLTVTGKKLAGLKGSNIGIFMVNLTKGSMMGPHWNPMATEIAVVVEGRGMVRVVCPSIANAAECQNMRFEVEEGDVFAVPRFHPMAQMAFNNGTFVFMGFTTSAKKNYPQFLAGQASVLRTLDRDIVAAAFNATTTTTDQLLAAQGDSVILECTSCAEEELRIMEEEIEREKEKAREREEEAARKREEEKRREEEEARKREEEEARREEEQRREKEEEEARKREEEEKRREEEEARKREEEEARREEEQRREKEEEEARKMEEEARREEEEARKREEEEEEEARRREEEEEAQRKQEAEEARRREQEEQEAEEAAAQSRQEEEEARRREQEEAQRRQEEEEARRREQEQEEEEAGRREQEEEQGGRSEEEQARQEEKRSQEAAESEEEATRQEEEERKRRQRERERGRGEEEGRREEEAEEAGQEGERGMAELWGRRVLKRLTI